MLPEIELETLLVLLAPTLVALICLVVTIIIAVRQSRLLQRYRLLLNGNSEKDLETILLTLDTSLDDIRTQLANLSDRMDQLDAQTRLHIQKMSMLRYNAFPDTGSDLSFSVALLDGGNNGFVLSSLYGRHESRVYAKPIKEGASTYALSDEEKAVLRQAMAVDGGENKS